MRFFHALDVDHALNVLTLDERNEQWQTLIERKIGQVYDKLNAESGGRCPEINEIYFSTNARLFVE